MPSTVTHTYFAMDVYQKLPIPLKELLQHETEGLKLFGQSMDALFFYNITNLKRGKRIRLFGHYFHEHASQTFFITLINYIKYNGYETNPSVISFLCGMICHYILDSTTHPYIIYYSGIYDKTRPSSIRYKQKHEFLETAIDNYFIYKREGVKPYHFRVDQFCFPSYQFNASLKEVIDFTFKETFDIHHMSRFYEKALQQMHFFYRHFRYDPTGIKQFGYTIIDHVTPKQAFRFTTLSYHQKEASTDFLNQKHALWYHPFVPQKAYHYSFIELYLAAIRKAVTLITEVYAYITGTKEVDLATLFLDLSYVSGLPCSQLLDFQQFSF